MWGFAIDLPSEPQAGRRARRMLRRSLARCVPAETLADVLAVVTELVNNATVHGDGREIKVRVEVDRDGKVVGEVVNQGSGEVESEAFERSAGLGLRIVDSLATRWNVLADGPTTVKFELIPRALQKHP